MGIYLKGLVVALAVLGVFVLIYSDNAPQPIYRHTVVDKLEDQGLTPFQLPDFIRGGQFDIRSIGPKVIIVNFWATWCEPCAKEIPDMVKLVQHFKGEVVLVAVSNDEDEDELRAFIGAFGGLSKSNVYVLRDADRKIADSYGVERLPESFIFLPNGKLARKVVGYVDWFNDSSVQYFSDLLQSKGSQN